ncbi:hypothetical protein CFOLD11_11610 [Clostridium folliculivorans]|uniref:Transposase IS66 central domain-containing protein n=1 Tax=Clostridium folliculivorans TaxID=2886038 RepID=A0A9W5Y0M9_9CLOT|nr:hypothetical protein CFOLD11_11610 [Clostridium folliculivorans]
MSAAEALEPIYSHMKNELLNRNYIHADETTLKVINDNCKDSKSKKYMWIYMSNTDSKTVILYDYQSTRASSCPKNFLENLVDSFKLMDIMDITPLATLRGYIA